MKSLVDLNLATGGYLRALDGRLRYLCGLDRIAEDTVAEHALVEWGRPFGGKPGVAYCWTRYIILAPWLFDQEPAVIRDVWTEELSHIVAGPSEERTLEYRLWHYGDLLWPDFVTRIEG